MTFGQTFFDRTVRLEYTCLHFYFTEYSKKFPGTTFTTRFNEKNPDVMSGMTFSFSLFLFCVCVTNNRGCTLGSQQSHKARVNIPTLAYLQIFRVNDTSCPLSPFLSVTLCHLPKYPNVHPNTLQNIPRKFPSVAVRSHVALLPSACVKT